MTGPLFWKGKAMPPLPANVSAALKWFTEDGDEKHLPTPESEKVRRENLLYVQNIYTGEIEAMAQDRARTETVPGTSWRLLAADEAAKLVPIFREAMACQALGFDKGYSKFDEARRHIAQRWDRSPADYLNGFDERLRLVDNEAERKQRLDIKGWLEYGMAFNIPAQARYRELMITLKKVAAEWREVSAKAAIEKADALKRDENRKAAEVQGEYLKTLARAAKETKT